MTKLRIFLKINIVENIENFRRNNEKIAKSDESIKLTAIK